MQASKHTTVHTCTHKHSYTCTHKYTQVMNSVTSYMIIEDDSTVVDRSGFQIEDGINSISIGGGLVLTDGDSVNSPVTVDTVVVEIINGSYVEQLFFSANHSSIEVSKQSDS